MIETEDFEVMVQLHDGRHPLTYPAALRFSGTQVVVTGEAFERSFPLADLAISPRVPSAPRFVALPDGTELECDDGAWLDVIPNQQSSEGPVAWLERRWWAALASIGLVASGLCLGYFFALDALCDKVVAVIPLATERSFGQHTVSSLGRLLGPSRLLEAQTSAVTTQFQRFRDQVPERDNLMLEFRDAPNVGPNAFTFPGGLIIVTDQLVNLLDNDQQVSAVIAHEIGHAHYRHSLRQAVRTSGTAVVAGALLGDGSSVAGGLSAGLVLLDTKYSREFESQADAFALQLLEKNQLSPALFADALTAIEADQHGANDGYSFLASHPDSLARIAGARAAASAQPKQ